MEVFYIKFDNSEKVNYILILILGFSFNFLIISGLNLFNIMCEKIGVKSIIIFIVDIVFLYPLFVFMIKGYNLILKLANVRFSNVVKKEEKMRIPTAIGLFVIFKLIHSTLQIDNISSIYIRLSAISLLAVIFLLVYLKYYEKKE